MKPAVIPDTPEALDPDLYVNWYETWRAGQDARRDAEVAARIEMQREIRWMVYVLVGWSLVAGAAGGLALVLWTTS